MHQHRVSTVESEMRQICFPMRPIDRHVRCCEHRFAAPHIFVDLRNLLRFTLALFVLASTANRSFAHEGHQPLPTKGVQVDTQHGHVTLSAQARAAIGLRSAELQVGDVDSTLVTYTETVAPWQAKAVGSAQISGRITRLLVRPGDTVSKGQVVAELTSRELENVRLSYLQAKNDLALNRKLLESMKPAAVEGAVPLQRLDEIENAYQQSENDLEIAKIRAATLGLDAARFDDTSQTEFPHLIRSPIAGKIVHSDLSEGKFVEAFEHLFEIVNLDDVWLKVQVLEKDVPKLSVGQSIAVRMLDTDVSFESEINRIDMALDPQGQVCWAWATVSKTNVMPGMVGSAVIRLTNEPNRMSVPEQSIYSDGLQNYVFVEEASTKAGSEFKKRNVRIGSRTSERSGTTDRYVEIVQGDVYPGDRVVVQGGHELSSLFFLGVLKLSSDERSKLGIRTAMASERRIASALSLPATATLPTEARWSASSQLAGTIESHELAPGKSVHAGDILFEISSPDFQTLQLDLLRASLDAALNRKRADRLEQSGRDAFSRRLLLELLNRADQLELKTTTLKRQLLSLGLTEDEVENIVARRQIRSYLPVRSAIDGFLIRWNGTLGETVTANQSLAEVQQVQKVWVEAQVLGKESSNIVSGMSGNVRVLSNPTIQFAATVTRIGPIVSPTTRTQRIWLEPNSLPESFLLRDQMQLTVILDSGILEGNDRATSLAVPNESVLRDGLHSFVFVQRADGYVDRRRVTTGRSDGTWTEIRSGVSVGEEVITGGARELQTAYASLR
ncbi:MAG: efflux RND transporter periplasmic adaptor subunit [Pirellulales bacterium]